MNGYSEFLEDVQKVFYLIIKEYNLLYSYEVEEKNEITLVKLYNKSLEIKFSLDKMELDVTISKAKEGLEFQVLSVIRWLKKNKGEDFNYIRNEVFPYSRNQVISDLDFYCNIFTSELETVLKGDFTWQEGLYADLQEKNRVFSMVMQLNYNHPIYKLTISKGDKNWYNKAKKFFDSGIIDKK